MKKVKPNGLEHFLLGEWAPCAKVKYTELGARIRLAKIQHQAKNKRKYHNKRKECAMYFCKECQMWHLTSIKQ